MMRKLAIFIVFLNFTAGCASINDDDKKTAPKIEESMEPAEMVDIAIQYGGETIARVKEMAKAKGQGDAVRALTEGHIIKGERSMSAVEVSNAVSLHQSFAKSITPELYDSLFRSERPAVRRIGWQLASVRPTKKTKLVIEREITRAIWDGEERNVLIPEMAKAVQENGVKNTYTILRQGLMTTGHDEFARAMIYADPKRANHDFMGYLAKASIDDLRQLNQKDVNLYACLVILKFYTTHEPPIAHPNFSHLFLYAVSRNQTLAELANIVLESMMTGQRDTLATNLSRLPVWIQVAFVEGARKRISGPVGVFLSTLKQTTSHTEVIQEIESIKL